MRRLRAAKNEVVLSLFPFLAVLICTMGSLIVLLVVVVRSAKVQADEIAAAEIAESAAERQRRQESRQEQQRLRDDHLWRLEILAAQRAELARELERRRLELSHLEEHHGRLKEQLEQRLQQAAELSQHDQHQQQNREALAAELTRLREAIARAEQDLEAARGQVEATQRSYALMPYDGPNGTRRRPIYIECTQEAVIIQPDGITLSPSDFGGPLGAGNPLDSALRAAREHMAASGQLAQGEEPYPLLVVRPGGSISYAAARAAMTSWDDEFGYELIDGDMKLAYGEADARRAELMARAVDESRKRTDAMRIAAPARFEGSEILSFNERPSQSAGPSAGLQRGGGRGAGPGSSMTAGASVTAADAARAWQQTGGYASDEHSSGEHGSDGQAAAAGRNAAAAPANRPGSPADGSAAGRESSPGAVDQFPQRVANSRGANWAVPGASSEATGYNRPISVICHADRLELPAVGDAPMQTIAFLGPTGNAVGPLVESIARRVQSWGIAGRGAYWKPVLRFDVQADAEHRFRDLKILLDRSGLELERK